MDTIPRAEEENKLEQALKIALAPYLGIVAAAKDFHARGLNVFPIPRRYEVEAAAAAGIKHNGKGYNPDKDKPPYILKPFYTARLHICGPECRRRAKLTGVPCCKLPETAEALFSNANLAVMTGRTSLNLVALDCDTEAANKAVQAEQDRRGLTPWAYSTHRGAVFLYRLAEGEADNNPNPPIPGLEIWGRLHYVVLPPSKHPLGTIYQWLTPDPYYALPPDALPPLVSADSLAWAGVTIHNPRKTRKEKRPKPDLLGLPPWAIHLSAANRKILATGANEGQRNTQLTKATYDLAALELEGLITETQALETLERAANLCNPPYPLRQIDSMWKTAVATNPTPAKTHYGENKPIRDQFTEIEAWALSYPWTGRTAQTDRAVFLACVKRAYMDGRQPFRASIREVAELANIKKETAAKALKRLRGAPTRPAGCKTPVALELASQKARNTKANLYRFKPNPTRAHGGHYPPLVVCSGPHMRVSKPIPETPAELDVFSRLGPISWRVWTYLIDHPTKTYAEIARAIGCHAGSVARAITKDHGLENHGLVIKTAGLYHGQPKTEADLERLAAAIGWKGAGGRIKPALGRSAKRKREHMRDRERRINQLLAKARAKWLKRYESWQARR